MKPLASLLTAIYVLLALMHVYWGLGGRSAWLAAVPEVEGRPSFTPSATATFAVAIALLACATLVAALGDLITLPLPATLLRWFGFALAAVFALRAVGEFRLVGFFKTVVGTRFATFDTWLFSPLCLLLALGVLTLALARRL